MREGWKGSFPASLLLFAMILPGSLGAQEAVSNPEVRTKSLEEGETIILAAGESTVIDAPWKVKRILPKRTTRQGAADNPPDKRKSSAFFAIRRP